jgi:hypothetical protein
MRFMTLGGAGTRPGKSGTYRMRQVHFDAMSRVASTLAEVYYD